MDAKDIKEISEAVSSNIIILLDERYTRKNVGDEHDRILKGKNGEAGLVERVRTNTRGVRRIYAAVGVIGGAVGVEAINRIFEYFSNLH